MHTLIMFSFFCYLSSKITNDAKGEKIYSRKNNLHSNLLISFNNFFFLQFTRISLKIEENVEKMAEKNRLKKYKYYQFEKDRT